MNHLPSLLASIDVRHDSRSLAIAIAGLLSCVVLYLTYKFAWRRDYGMPVRRRLLCRRIRIERDQIAFVPFYWSDVQVQRAIRVHWKSRVRQGLHPGASAAGLTG
jgi:hypothetical protein